MSLMQRLKKNMTETVRVRTRRKDSKRKSEAATDRETKNKPKTVRKRVSDAKKSQRKAKKEPSTIRVKTIDCEEDPEGIPNIETPPTDKAVITDKKNVSEKTVKDKVITDKATDKKLPSEKTIKVADKKVPSEKTIKKEQASGKDLKKVDDKKDDKVADKVITDKKDDKKEEESKTGKKAKPKIWTGEEAAAKFFAKCNDIAKLRTEYAFLESLGCNKATEAFDKNSERNRPKAPKIYDENRVILNRPGQEGNNYINASFISVKDFPHKLIIAQLPRMENESFIEDFWHMIYQEQITLVYLLMPSETLKAAATKLFKEESGEYQYVGKMFINNRRADARATDPREYTIEVLPEGNSDSVMCQVHHHATWQHLQQPPKTHRIIKMIHQFLTEKEVQAAGVCVVSEFGSGRACTFIAALIAINMLNKGQEPNISEIMTNIKQQRPGATESFAQYTGIYAIILDYIRRKRTSKTDEVNKELTRLIDDLTDVTPPSSPAN